MYQLITSSSNRKRKSHKEWHSTKRSHNKQRKQVTFTQVQQNSSEVSGKTSPASEISPVIRQESSKHKER